MPDRDQLVLAALLHDIGAFRHRSFGEEGDPRQLGADWLRTKSFTGAEVIAALIAGASSNQENTALANQVQILAEANSLCCCPDEDAGKAEPLPAPTPLRAAFSSTGPADPPVESSNDTFWPLGPLEPGHTYPQSLSGASPTKKQYADLWRAFEGEFDTLLPAGLTVDRLLVLLEKYCACMPGAAPDGAEAASTTTVSLFDHAKTRAAVTCCLHDFFVATDEHAERNLLRGIADRQGAYYRLVMGKLSGVRKFVYEVNHPNDLAALKARSFFVELLTRHVVEEVVERLDLTWANVICGDGGRLCVLAQNTPGARMRLTKIEQTFNKWLLETFDGALHLAIAHAEVRGVDLAAGHRGKAWRDVVHELERKKNQQFAETLGAVFVPRESLLKYGFCSVCGGDHFDTDLIGDLCASCSALSGIQDALHDARLVVRSAAKMAGVKQVKLPRSDQSTSYYALLKDGASLERTHAERAYWINNWRLQDYRLDRSSQWLTDSYMAMAPIPAEGTRDELAREGPPAASTAAPPQKPATLDELAQAAHGRPEIGVVELRVSDLEPTAMTHPENADLAKAFSLYRQAGLFFKCYANEICRGVMPNGHPTLKVSQRPQDAPRNVTIVHSGTDRLLAVGAWDDVLEVAFDLREGFVAFAGSPHAGLSGSVVVGKPDHPLHKMIALTRRALLEADGNDTVTLFYDGRHTAYAHETGRQSRCVYAWQEARSSVATLVQDISTVCRMALNEGRVTSEWGEQLIGGLHPVLTQWEEAGTYYLPNLAHVLARVREALRRTESVDLRRWQRLSGFLMDTSRMKDLRTILVWLGLLAGTTHGNGRQR